MHPTDKPDKEDVFELPGQLEVINDFDLLVSYIFDFFIKELGFINAQLFMYNKKSNSLVFEKSDGNCTDGSLKKISIDNDQLKIVDSFKDNLIVESYNLNSVVGGDQEDDLISLVICLPIKLYNEVIGVFVVCGEDIKRLSSSEKLLLESVINKITNYLFAAWSLKGTAVRNDQLKLKNEKYHEIITLKKEFLNETQKLMIQILQEGALGSEKNDEVAQMLMYMNSVMLLSDSTTNKK